VLRAGLEDEIANSEKLVIDGALTRPQGKGVMYMEAGSVWASDAARWLDELHPICV
jgi:hypothetical protein